MAGPSSEDFNDLASGEDSGCWSDSGSSMPSHRLEQEAHKLGLRDREFLPGVIVSPQQTQIVGLMIRKTKSGSKGFQIKCATSCSRGIHRIFTETQRSSNEGFDHALAIASERTGEAGRQVRHICPGRTPISSSIAFLIGPIWKTSCAAPPSTEIGEEEELALTLTILGFGGDAKIFTLDASGTNPNLFALASGVCARNLRLLR